MCQPRPGNRCATDLRNKMDEIYASARSAMEQAGEYEDGPKRDAYLDSAVESLRKYKILRNELDYTPDAVSKTKDDIVKSSREGKADLCRRLREQKDVMRARSEFVKIAENVRKNGRKDEDDDTRLLAEKENGSKTTISVHDVVDGDYHFRVSKLYDFEEGEIPEANMRRTSSLVTVKPLNEGDGLTAYYDSVKGVVSVGGRMPEYLTIVAPDPEDEKEVDDFMKSRKTTATVNDGGIPFTYDERKTLSLLLNESGYKLAESK